MKLRDLIENTLNESTDWYEQKRSLTENQKNILFQEVSKYNEYGKAVYQEYNLVEMAKKLHALTEFAEKYLEEEYTGFDSVTVKRNMKELKKYVSEFKKAAKEVQENRDRLTALYEDMGIIFNRYFEIKDVEDDDDDKDQLVEPTENDAEEFELEHQKRMRKSEQVKKYGTLNDAFVLNENVKFDEKTMKKMIEQDHFLKHTSMTNYNGSPDKEDLKAMFNSFIVGDSVMEKTYKRIGRNL